jgi:precorrin-6B methylase 2
VNLYLNKPDGSNIMRTLKILIGFSIFLFATNYFHAQDCGFFESVTNRRDPPEKVMNAVGVKPGMIIGEIGAGWGRYAIPLAYRVGSSGRIFANDINPVRLEFIRYRCKRNNITNVETILGETDDPLFPKQPLDMVFIVDTYHALEDQFTSILLKIKPNLKASSKVVIVFPIREETLATLSNQAKKAGYTYEKLNNIYLYYNVDKTRFSQTEWEELVGLCQDNQKPGYTYDDSTGTIRYEWDVYILKIDKK